MDDSYGHVRHHTIPFFLRSLRPMLSKSDHNCANSSLPIAFAAKANRVPAQSITLHTEVTTDKTYERYQTSQISQDASSIRGERSSYDKPGGPGPDYDLERDAESGI